MKHNTKKWQASLLCITLCGILTACGSGKESQAEDMKNSETIQINETDMGAQQENGTEKETGGMEENRLIGEQTFEVTLEPLGKVTFASYRRDTQQNRWEMPCSKYRRPEGNPRHWKVFLKTISGPMKYLMRSKPFPFLIITATVSAIS